MASPDGVPPLQDEDIAWDAPEPVDSDAVTEVTVNGSSPGALPWGIFDADFNPVIVGDSVLAFEYTRDSAVAKYPVEGGGFASYNKVQQPKMQKFTFTKGGTASERTAFLASVDKAQDSLDLLIGVTSDGTYESVTIDHCDLRRTSRGGVTLLTVDVWCEQVRVAPPPQFSGSAASSDAPQVQSPKDPESASPTNGGAVQAAAQAPQQATPARPSAIGTINSGLTTPPTLTAPGINLTTAAGNRVPALASAVRSAITYSTPSGPATAVSGIVAGAGGQPTAYATRGGAEVQVNLVTNILPPGFTVLQ